MRQVLCYFCSSRRIKSERFYRCEFEHFLALTFISDFAVVYRLLVLEGKYLLIWQELPGLDSFSSYC